LSSHPRPARWAALTAVAVAATAITAVAAPTTAHATAAAATTTTLDVSASALSAAVSVDGSPTAAVSGSVRFLLGDDVIATVPLAAGRATLNQAAPAASTADEVSAEFIGSSELAASSDSAFREEAESPLVDEDTPADAVVGTDTTIGVTPGEPGATVTLSVEADAPGTTTVCRVTGTSVAFDHVGSCDLTADQAGDWLLLPASTPVSIDVAATDTITTVLVRPTSVSATVTAEDPSTTVPTGTVRFLVDDVAVGTARLTNGVATLSYKVRNGDEHSVGAEYLGSDDAAESSDETYRDDPTITAKVSSKVKKKAGWYRAPVKVSFECEEATDEVTCPATRVLSTSGAKQAVTATATAVDGGSASTTVRVSIDMVGPKVKVAGVTKGKTVKAAKQPKLRCVASDKLSGVSSCTLKQRVLKRSGKKTTIQYTAVATDKAGNTTKLVGSYVWSKKA